MFDEVCLLSEGGDLPNVAGDRLVVLDWHRRPRYEDFFALANGRVTGARDISVVANSDIYFDSSLRGLGVCLGTDQCAALCRWDVADDNSGTARLFDRNDSQDVWVFCGKIRAVVADFCVGIPRCDNRVLWELQRANYAVVNPALSVKVFHVHSGQRSEYPAELSTLHVDPPYAYMFPHNLMSLPRTLIHNWRHPECRIGWSLDRRQLGRYTPLALGRRLKAQLRRKWEGLVHE